MRKPANNQEALDRAYRHHVIDRKPLGYDSEYDTCVYIGEAGERCAIGCQIPVPLAKELRDLGVGSVSILRDDFPVWKTNSSRVLDKLESWFANCDIGFIEALQAAHDESFVRGNGSHEDVEAQYKSLAKAFKLSVPA